MSVAFWSALIWAAFFVAPTTSDIASEVARSCESPVNRLEYTTQHCIDSLYRNISEPKSKQLGRLFCDIAVAVWDNGRSSAVSIYNVSMHDFRNGLPESLRGQMSALHQSLEQDIDSMCNNVGIMDYGCMFKLNSVMFSDPSSDSMVGICAPCNTTSKYFFDLFQNGIDTIYPSVVGDVDFTYSIQGQGKDIRMLVEYEKDSVELSTLALLPKYMGENFIFSVTFKSGLSTSADDKFAVTMRTFTARASTEKYFCDDEAEEVGFEIKGGSRTVTVFCTFRDFDSWPLLSVPERLVARNITFRRDDKEGKLYLADWIGHFLTFCKFTAVSVRLKDGGYTNLCGSLYFVNGSRDGSAEEPVYHATILRRVNETELEGMMKEFTVQAVKIRNSFSAKMYHSFRFTVLARLCQPDLANRQCDSKWDQDELDNSTMNKIQPKICSHGHLRKSVNLTGYFGFCIMTSTTFNASTEVNQTNIWPSCFDLSERKSHSCKIVQETCECCCFATSDAPCNLNFIGGEFAGAYLNCLQEVQFGPFHLGEPNILRIANEIPSGKEMILPVEDLKDTNYRYDGLMQFFQINLTDFVIQQSGVVSPISHRYAANSNETLRFTSHSNVNRRFCALAKWKTADLAMGCRCFVTRKVLINCCCQRNAYLGALRELSATWIYAREWNYTALEHAFVYREEFIVDRNAVLKST